MVKHTQHPSVRRDYWEEHQADLSSVGYLTLTPDLVIKEANSSAAVYLGTSRDKLVGSRIDAHISSESCGLLNHHFNELLSGGKPQVNTIKVHQTQGADIYLQLSSAPLGNPIREIRSSLVDVTEMVEAKDRAELYIDVIAHDVNNLNAGAIGYLQLLAGREDLGEKEKRWIERALEALEDSSRLIENVRKIQKMQTKDLRNERIDLGSILGNVAEQFHSIPGKEVRIDLSPAEGRVVVANELLIDVFSNIVGNAVKHSKGPVIVGIEVDTAESDGNKYHVVSIADNGPGIPQDMKEKIFARFQNGSKRTRGKGIGLYLVKRLVESFGGRVWVEDRVQGDYGRGAKFVVELPAAPPD